MLYGVVPYGTAFIPGNAVWNVSDDKTGFICLQMDFGCPDKADKAGFSLSIFFYANIGPPVPESGPLHPLHWFR